MKSMFTIIAAVATTTAFAQAPAVKTEPKPATPAVTPKPATPATAPAKKEEMKLPAKKEDKKA